MNRITLDGVRDTETAVLWEYEIHELTISVVGAVAQRLWEVSRTLQHNMNRGSSSVRAVNWSREDAVFEAAQPFSFT